jgi:hypothetical protein
MSASATLPPTGQDHDRDDAEMRDEEPASRDASTNTIAVHISAVEEEEEEEEGVEVVDQDVMDVTPDIEILLPNGSAEAVSQAWESRRPLGHANTRDRLRHFYR